MHLLAIILSLLQHQLHGAMVGAVDFVVYGGRLYLRSEAVGDDEVIDAPTGVLLACVEAV